MSTLDYLEKNVWCTIAPSPIHGVGVFAIRDIRKGTKLTDNNYSSAPSFFPEKLMLTMSLPDFEKLDEGIRNIILDRTVFHENYHKEMLRFMSPNKHAVLQLFMNHSDTPNSDGVYALSDIKKGEEITEDFSKLVSVLHKISKQHFHFLK